jgi:hypothetical protein
MDDEFELEINIELLNTYFCVYRKKVDEYLFYITLNNGKSQLWRKVYLHETQNFILTLLKQRPRPVEFVKKIGGYKAYKKSLERLSTKITKYIEDEYWKFENNLIRDKLFQQYQDDCREYYEHPTCNYFDLEAYYDGIDEPEVDIPVDADTNVSDEEQQD